MLYKDVGKVSSSAVRKICEVGSSARERSGSVVECWTQDRGPRVRASPALLCCVLEQDTLILA